MEAIKMNLEVSRNIEQVGVNGRWTPDFNQDIKGQSSDS
jgi:hypothetical protein